MLSKWIWIHVKSNDTKAPFRGTRKNNSKLVGTGVPVVVQDERTCEQCRGNFWLASLLDFFVIFSSSFTESCEGTISNVFCSSERETWKIVDPF